MQELLWAIRFLTIIPLGSGRGGGTPPLPPERMGRVMVFYPLVGLIIGLCLVLVYYPLAVGLPSAPADALIILFYVFLTGGLHMDGLADSLDGLLGGWDRQSRLDIMKDSCIGTFGTIGVVGDMGLRFVFLQDLPDFLPDVSLWSPLTVSMDISSHTVAGLHKEVLKGGVVLLTMVVVGRWAQTLAASISPYARAKMGTASGLVAHTGVRHCLAASVLPLFLVGTFYGTRGMVMLAVVCAVVLLLTSYTRSRIGGVTGDTLGMTNEVSELVFLFLFFVI
ncbi:MAG TPA: adenosylcobinamide-GDP ribazoletransferase [Candidatus Tripitaka californicus]|uniref:adenosylcobinamide-GDP ribazoletransferase n=1 Tax=Candidatus Tripitaka californicus TaxID=3367616 RepID=UPI0040262A33